MTSGAEVFGGSGFDEGASARGMTMMERMPRLVAW